MIRTLVIDDDFRVAGIHAASVDRVAGFVCVGQAHTAAEARRAIAESAPDLLLLDLHLPDEDGLSLLRSLDTAAGRVSDCIVISAARDLDAVRAAMQLGAIYYLVKPFGFAQLKDQLEAYRRWRTELDHGAGTDTDQQVDQDVVDNLYNLLRGPAGQNATASALPPTMATILNAVRAGGKPLAATEIAEALGLSRPTAQRYLTQLERQGLIELQLEYGSAGRPVNRYRVTRPGRTAAE
ncbi:MAG: response regulator [Amycolatopsis sp.]|jgi:response regulator of citrate/malate metabolism|uniref:response regulator n=1 Tax=Amycolatopsis sp. TaxID=37632 RepID=UPI0026044BD3|nr:response regulator [Amycolatopsis sp.]MCU1686168.1 response regulator [Amycolatopsis sp.]